MKVKAKKIALYPNASVVALKDLTDIDSFLADIRSGRWQDPILRVRSAPEHLKKGLKEKLPDVTISGIFSERTNDTLITHSGYIAVDIDAQENLKDVPALRDTLGNDPFVYACFISCGGQGLCALVKVNPRAHIEAYSWMSRHFYTKYRLDTDPVCHNLARIRYVSYDPDAAINPNAVECPAEPATKKEKKLPSYIFKSEDFDRILKEIQEKNINLTETYNDWMLCALSLQNKFEAETAREYFHLVSSIHPDYDEDQTDKKFDSLAKDNRGEIPIDWFYNHVEKNGIKPYGKETEAALMFHIFDEAEKDPEISNEVAKAQLDGLPVATKIKMYLNYKHQKYIKNQFTESITADEEQVDDELFNTWYVELLEKVDEKVTPDLLKRIVHSHFIKKHHPFKEFIQPYLDNPPAQPTGYIDEIIASITTETPHAGIFLKKWLVCMVASAFGIPTVFVLVLCGDQDTGKTEWFKRILPDELAGYRSSLNWSGDRDEVIRMSRNLIMLDDEMGGKSQREEKQIKKITSLDKEQTRAAYATMDKNYNRLAVFCGTTNDDWFLSDPSGNRRFLPVYVNAMDHPRFNKIDKGLLFYELYMEYKNGFNLSLTPQEQLILNENSAKFTKPHLEEELIDRYLAHPGKDEPGEYMTATDIFGYLKSKYPWQPIRVNPLGAALKKAGFKSVQKRIGGKSPHVYTVVKVNTDFIEQNELPD